MTGCIAESHFDYQHIDAGRPHELSLCPIPLAGMIPCVMDPVLTTRCSKPTPGENDQDLFFIWLARIPHTE